ncbi:unnamed protein product [Vitrella brassicaformis CCMP3155]|uniref:Uncharacterized protein n=2 Tax=Vitrella brassicaformis TaxID=1169539 RepID=A0A0G4EVU8_VITBC|nr:unnamed protein product [Vitrella brassicaformis CCMP3155]|eukprot:CEM02815.1 unnamed protein product [Vitrella brassicaformis CCMP3155]
MDVWLDGGLVFVTPLPSLCTVAVTATGSERLSLLSSQVSHPTALTITAGASLSLRDCLSDLTIAAPPTLSPSPSSTARVLFRSPGSNEAALSVTLTAVNQPPTLTAAHPVVFVSAGRTVSIGSKASITFADDGMGGGGVDRLEAEVRVTGDGTVALAPSAPVSPTTAEYRPSRAQRHRWRMHHLSGIGVGGRRRHGGRRSAFGAAAGCSRGHAALEQLGGHAAAHTDGPAVRGRPSHAAAGHPSERARSHPDTRPGHPPDGSA